MDIFEFYLQVLLYSSPGVFPIEKMDLAEIQIKSYLSGSWQGV